MSGVTVTIEGIDKLQQRLDHIARTSYPAAVETVKRAALMVETKAKHNVSGKPLRTRTGRLRSSITHIAEGLHAIVGTNVVYGAIHEFGGVIVPRKAKMLAIPIGDLKGSPRQYSLHVGGSVLFDASGKPQYALKHSVKMPRRRWLSSALKSSIDKIEKMFVRRIERLLEGK